MFVLNFLLLPVQVILTCTVDVIDLLGIYVCLTKFTARYDAAASKIKVLSTVVGEWVRSRGERERERERGM